MMRSKKPLGAVWPLLILLAPLAWGLQKLALANSALTENLYSQAIYPFIARPISNLFGLLPFSVTEVIIVSCVIWAPAMVHLFWRGARKRGARGWRAAGVTLTKTCSVAACGYFVFMLLCGLNYARQPYAQTADYDVSAVSRQELADTCRILAAQANSLREQLPEDENGVFSASDSLAGIAARTDENYANAAAKAPWLSGSYGTPKPVLLSSLWAYTKTTGMFFPFTVEANYNRVNSPCMFAVTMAHEAAHQRGFMREDEANFIAFYVCAEAENPQDRYSGYILALIYATNALCDADADAYVDVRASFSDAVVRDLAAHSALWKKYDGKTAELHEQVNDGYLKANSQDDGVKSYGRMVDLLVGYYRASGAL